MGSRLATLFILTLVLVMGYAAWPLLVRVITLATR
jgi:hypothetical protein